MGTTLDLSGLFPKSKEAADFFRNVVSESLPELLGHVDGQCNQARTEQVKHALQNISRTYRCKLGHTDPGSRTEWDNAANRCAYVFLYYMQHCNMVYIALQPLLRKASESITQRWRQMSVLRVCCIGGGPAPDLVGLTKFLNDTSLIPVSMLRCSVLDAFPSWKTTWDAIRQTLPTPFPVNYLHCDLVKDTTIERGVLDTIRRADFVTLIKCFSAVSIFMRNDTRKSFLFQAILRELKPGAIVLYIDNEKNLETWDCFGQFASSAGLDVLYEWHGKPVMPTVEESPIIQNYASALALRPMKSCVVSIVVLRKTRPSLSLVGVFEPNGPAVVSRPGIAIHIPSVETRFYEAPEVGENGKVKVEWPYRKSRRELPTASTFFKGAGDT